MKKKESFLPAIKSRGNFEDLTSVHAIGTEYMDHRDKLKLSIPDRTFVKTVKLWNILKTCDGDLFFKEVRQEQEIYDLDALKYMRKTERGI